MQLEFQGKAKPLFWQGSPRDMAFSIEDIAQKLSNTHLPCYVVRDFRDRIGVSNGGQLVSEGRGLQVLASAQALAPDQLGDPSFLRDYKLKQAYKTGAMANGIASSNLVVAMGKADMLGSFGAAGLVADRILTAIQEIKNGLPHQSYAFNLIHSPVEAALEANAVQLFLDHQIRIVEASAYLGLTEHIVHYRAAGLERSADGKIITHNKVIAKISRTEVATHFMKPAPQDILERLVQKNKITAQQAQWAQQIPMADDITVEADSGGHTDNRTLVALLPTIIKLRDKFQAEYQYQQPIRIGAAGGIATPASALAAFMMGAAYIVTGSVNQACIEAGTSEHVRKLLQTVASTDVMMAPASDMFEMGVELQVLKRGTLFGPRAKKLYEYYKLYKSIDEIPAEERKKLEVQVFKKPLEEIWQACISFFQERDPAQLERAQNNPHRKMALIFRWYLGLSSNWANAGTPDRFSDMQIWCGPAMGAFNDWVKGTYLESYANRKAAEIADHIMAGAAYLYRIQSLKMQGLILPTDLENYTPTPKKELALSY